MKILVTGATGFVGRALVLRLGRDGHSLSAWVRDPARAAARLGSGVRLIDAGSGDDGLRAAIAGVDAVVHLAGEPVAGRWTRARRARLTASRVALGEQLRAACAARARPLPVLITASAIGVYGDRGDEVLTEASAPGDGFLAALCTRWEAATAGAAARVVALRLGVVLGPDEGALGAMAPIFKLGLGGRLGDGAQWLSWIHRDDAVEAIVHALADARLAGPVNVVAPAPVRQRDFARALAASLGRRAPFAVPRLALRAALGEAAAIVLASQRVAPRRLAATGFTFRFPDLDGALADLASPAAIAIERARPADAPSSAYLRRRRPRYVLRARTVIDAPLEQVFAFFASAENLARITPPGMGFDIVTPLPLAMRTGAIIDYRVRVGGVPLRWRTGIEAWQPGARFVDTQLRGPYRAWWHEHAFRRDGARTIMDDAVYYAPPLGLLGALADRLFIRGQLRHIFGYRALAIRLAFGGSPPAEACTLRA